MVGIICLDKPEGITSSKALVAVRRALGVKKAGHTGTLDPMATGVLPIFMGQGTRLIGALPTRAKAYRAQIQLGLTTDTLDITGQVVERRPASVTRGQLEHLLDSFVGVEFQEQEQLFTITVRCSEGTYIRTIADDIGRLLGCGACLKTLRRLYSSGFGLSDCLTLDQVQALAAAGELEEHLMPVDRAFGGYAPIAVAATQAARLRNGAPLALERIGNPPPGTYRIYERGTGRFVGIGRTDSAGGSLRGKVILNLE